MSFCPQGWGKSLLAVLWQDKYEILAIVWRNIKKELRRKLLRGS